MDHDDADHSDPFTDDIHILNPSNRSMTNCGAKDDPPPEVRSGRSTDKHGDRSGEVVRISLYQASCLVGELRDPTRARPWIVVSVVNASWRPLLSAQDLRARCSGLAVVVELVDVATSYAFSQALVDAGLDERLGCYNGAVRIYAPGLSDRRGLYEHPLLLPGRLLTFGRDERIELVMAGLDGSPPASVESGAGLRAPVHELTKMRASSPKSLEAARRSLAERARRSASVSPADVLLPPVASPRDDVGVDREIDGSPADVLPAAGAVADHAGDMERVAADLERARASHRAVEAECGQLRQKLRGQERAVASLRGLLASPSSVAHALKLAGRLFGDKLAILPSAERSAGDSSFRDPTLVLGVLVLLAICEPGSVARTLRDLFGHRARPRAKDSPETAAAFEDARRWKDRSGTRQHYRQHVTLGKGMRADQCLQIYFDHCDDGLVEIAWCGKHQPTVSHDT